MRPIAMMPNVIAERKSPNPTARPQVRRTRFVNGLIVLILVVFNSHLFAQSPEAAFDSANKLYEEGKYGPAADAYKTLVQTGRVSPALLFNWGNALFKAGQLGRAIDAYLQAQALSPHDPDIRANLQFARNRVQGPTLMPEPVVRWLWKLSLTEWTWLAAVCLWVWLLSFAVFQLRPALKSALRGIIVWGGIGTLLACTCFGASFYSHRVVQRAIVIVSEANVRLAPLEESQIGFTLRDGAELQILDQKDQWLQVRVDGRRSGWIRKEDVVTPST